ncbi:Zinc finger BED domain-containing protein RICESLEEPER 2 [Vitis vinifera]|uniref:Zinc finger BED domain-containing protein RICESLEEPER 2 n=1 Tax=Vitis vinifera TaxID=29760 RepID=A0A438IEV6_VITVI|nr:Zinc finger BED domain-containing protein RICESLEEPER 2 [Vitis vinifera]
MPSAGSTPITGSTSTTDGILVSKRRKLTSVVWNDFDKIIEDGQDYAICKHCKGKLKADSKNGTKHLHVHIDRCMKQRNVDIRQQLLAVERKGHGKVQIGGFTFDQEISREKLARAIILHEYPLSIIDHVGFREFATSLQPLFKMVSRNTIKGDIMKIYEVEKDKMISYLEKLQSRVAITIDMWTSNQKKGYMAITVHYIDESWLLHHHIVRFVYVPPPHTKEVLSDVLMDFLLDWNMDRKVSTVTVDNCSSNDGMINILVEKLCLSDSLLLNGKIFHMRCVAHVLNLIVKEGLDVIEVEIEKIRESVAYWSATPSRMEKFEDAARQLRIPCNKKLSLDCSTLLELNYDEQDHLSKFDLFVHSTIGASHTKSELDYYLEESILPRNSNFDVLSWWKTNGIKYPTLQMTVRDIYAIPVSIVASESAFSTGGRVVSKHRTRLHLDTLEALMCAQSWLWKKKEGDSSIHDSQPQLTMMDENDDLLVL